MKLMSNAALIALLSFHFSAFSSELSTKWNIKNNSKENISLTCKLLSEDESYISMTTKPIMPGKTEVFDWGDNYYNDGLWLNAGQWKCNAKNKGKQVTEFDLFKTDWGEVTSLVINTIDGKLKLEKVEKTDSAIASKEKEKAK